MVGGIGASMGKVSLAAVECSKNQQINAIICNEKIVECRFLFFCLSVMRDYIFNTTKFTTLPILNQKETKNIVVPFPPLAEQTAIAAYLDDKCSKIDNNIKTRERLISKLADYKNSLIYEVVTGKKEIVS